MPELNLIPQDLNTRDRALLKIKKRVILILVIIFFLIAGTALPIFELKSINAKEKRLRTEIKIGEGVFLENEKLQKEIDGYKAYIAEVERVLKFLPDPYDKIRGLEDYMVDNVSFVYLSWKNGVIVIKARSNSCASLCVFVANLQESKDYSRARIAEINPRQNETEYLCTISITY